MIITFNQIEEQDLNQNSSDKLAIGIAVLSMLMIVCLPIIITYQAILKVKCLKEFDEEKYGFLLAEVKTEHVGQAIASTIFIIRRMVYVILLFFMNNLAGL